MVKQIETNLSNKSTVTRKECWVVTDGSIGMQNQAIGLAEALSFKVVIKNIKLKSFWNICAPFFRFWKKYCLSATSDKLLPPFPELIIATGRRAILPALYVKEESGNATKVIYIQNPKIAPSYFDVVICPKHDSYDGPNVLKMTGSPHRVNEHFLKIEKKKFANQFAAMPRPIVAVIIGGPNKVYTLDLNVAKKIANELRLLQKKYNCAFLITASRRTPNVVMRVFKDLQKNYQNTYFWSGIGQNPYYGFLALADFILVTSDSVNMVSEACSTDKPVYLINLPGGSAKFTNFHAELIKAKRLRRFEGVLENYKFKSFNNIEKIAVKIRKLIELTK